MDAKRLTRSLILLIVFVPVPLCVFRLLEHHWPGLSWWLGFLLGWVLADAYGNIVKLLERQNLLLERVLLVLADEKQQDELPVRRR